MARRKRRESAGQRLGPSRRTDCWWRVQLVEAMAARAATPVVGSEPVALRQQCADRPVKIRRLTTKPVPSLVPSVSSKVGGTRRRSSERRRRRSSKDEEKLVLLERGGTERRGGTSAGKVVEGGVVTGEEAEGGVGAVEYKDSGG